MNNIKRIKIKKIVDGLEKSLNNILEISQPVSFKIGSLNKEIEVSKEEFVDWMLDEKDVKVPPKKTFTYGVKVNGLNGKDEDFKESYRCSLIGRKRELEKSLKENSSIKQDIVATEKTEVIEPLKQTIPVSKEIISNKSSKELNEKNKVEKETQLKISQQNQLQENNNKQSNNIYYIMGGGLLVLFLSIGLVAGVKKRKG